MKKNKYKYFFYRFPKTSGVPLVTPLHFEQFVNKSVSLQNHKTQVELL
jgi:hypothetical protein